MPILDFREIPTAAAGAARDLFELFAREFLELMGFRTIVGPDRGADGRRDLIVEELRTGIAGETRIRWLVSCKHKAHTGASVLPGDEPDIHDRVKTHGCDGFMGFYSTVPSMGLATKLNAAGPSFEVRTYDTEKIETELLRSPAGRSLVKRFFPMSWAKWNREHPKPAELLFSDQPTLSCAYCQKRLLQPTVHGNVVIWTKYSEHGGPRKERTEHVYWCCQGACEEALCVQYRKADLDDGWVELSELINPMGFIRCVVACLNQFNSGMTYSATALKDLKALLISIFPLVCRDVTEAEKEQIKWLMLFPSDFGGWP